VEHILKPSVSIAVDPTLFQDLMGLMLIAIQQFRHISYIEDLESSADDVRTRWTGITPLSGLGADMP